MRRFQGIGPFVLATAAMFGVGSAASAATINITADITTSQTWTSDNEYILTQPIYVTSGATLTILPVRARMVTDEAVYVERTDAGGVVGRLLNIQVGPRGKLVQRALTFTQDGQWRNLREQPELFTALLPKDVRPAGTCDIEVSKDANTLTYSCGGSKPETFLRRQ